LSEIKQTFSEVPSFYNIKQVEVSFRSLIEDTSKVLNWVLDVNSDDGKVLLWSAFEVKSKIGSWVENTHVFELTPDLLRNFNRIKTYGWNKEKISGYIDNIRIKFLGIPKDEQMEHFTALKQTSFYYDLESDTGLERTESINDEISHSGKHSSLMDGKNEYSVWIVKTHAEIMNDTIKEISAGVWLYSKKDEAECTIVLEVRNSEEEQIYWNGKSTKSSLKAESWQKLNAIFNLSPEEYRKFSANDKFYIYVINNSRTDVYADDLEVTFGGIPDRRGKQIHVDMNSLDHSDYKFVRQHAPYPISYLQKEDIQNSNSTYLINDSYVRIGKISPEQFIAAGNFTGIVNDRDELLVVQEKSIEIFHYCDIKKRFLLSGSQNFNGKEFSTAKIVCGNFTGEEKKELLFISKNSSLLIGFSSSSKKCTDGQTALMIKTIWSGKMENIDGKYYAGNFLGSSNEELLIADTTGKYTIKQFEKTEWATLRNDSTQKNLFGNNSVHLNVKYSSSHDELLTVYKDKYLSRIVVLNFEQNKVSIKRIFDDSMGQNVLSTFDMLYPMNSNYKQFTELLAFNNQWRTELKYIMKDNKGLYVSATLDFKGYPADQNPKYYEIIKILPGNFTGKNKSILCILYNCADQNYNGRKCLKYDSLPDLPNSIQLYNFSK
jgi:hypothetical protein